MALARGFGEWQTRSVGGGAPQPYTPITVAPPPPGPQPAPAIAVTVAPAGQSTLPPGGSVPAVSPGGPWTTAPVYLPPPAPPPTKILGLPPMALVAIAGGGLLIFLIARRL